MEKTKVETLYENEKSRGFVNHLIGAYMPINKAQKVFTFEKPGVHKCSVCNHELLDLDTIFQRSTTDEYIKQSLKEFTGRVLEKEDAPKTVEETAMYRLVTHGAVMAWTGENTNTELCADCVKDLLNLVTNGLFAMDKNITYQVNKIKRTQVFNVFKVNPKLDDQEKEKVAEIQKKIETNKKNTVTLGDFGVLQQLKEKMEKESTNTK